MKPYIWTMKKKQNWGAVYMILTDQQTPVLAAPLWLLFPETLTLPGESGHCHRPQAMAGAVSVLSCSKQPPWLPHFCNSQSPNCSPKRKGQESPVFEYTLSRMPLYFGSDLTTSNCGSFSCHVVVGLKMSRQQSPPYSASHGPSQ